MKILHIWDTAGAGSIISRELQKMEINSHTIAKKNLYNFDEKEKWQNRGNSTKPTITKAIIIAKKFDILHLHTIDQTIPLFKKIYPKKKIVLTYHGSDIRSNHGRDSSIDFQNNKINQWHKRKKYWELADAIIVTTPDLLEGAPKEVKLIRPPIEREVWKRQNPYEKNTAIYSRYKKGKQGEADKLAYKWTEKNNIKLRTLDRKEKIIPYQKFPRFLERFEYYIDVKQGGGGDILEVMSGTGLQALSLGCKVYHNKKIHKKFPKEADSKNVAKEYLKLYRSLT